MKREEIKIKVIDVLVDKLGVDKEEITEETNVQNDLGGDSLDWVELIMEFELVFDKRYRDEDAYDIRTVKEIIDFIEEQGTK